MADIANPYTAYQGIIEVLQPDGNPRLRSGWPLTTQRRTGQQFGTLQVDYASPACFTLQPDRLVGSGQLVVLTSEFDSDFGSCPIQENDVVVFKPQEGIEWARLIAKAPARSDRHRFTVPLVGESEYLFGRPCVDVYAAEGGGWETQYTPSTSRLVWGNFNYYPVNIEGGDETGNNVKVVFTRMLVGEIVKTLALQGLSYYLGHYWQDHLRIMRTGSPWAVPDGWWGGVIEQFEITQQQTFAEAFAALAAMSERNTGIRSAWGIGNGWWGNFQGETTNTPNYNASGRALAFGPIPTDSVFDFPGNYGLTGSMGIGLSSAQILDFVPTSAAPFYNICEVSGYGGASATIQDNDSITAHGGACSRARLCAPNVRTARGLEDIANAFLDKYARGGQVWGTIRAIIPSADGVPWPWAGMCRISAGPQAGEMLPIKSVRVSFERGQALAEISIGDTDHPKAFGSSGDRPGSAFSRERLKEKKQAHGHENPEPLNGIPPYNPSAQYPDLPPLSAVAVLTATPIGDGSGQATLSWSPPTGGGGSDTNWRFVDGE